MLCACLWRGYAPWQPAKGADYQTLSDSPSENDLARAAAGRPSAGSTLPKGSPPKGAGSTLPKRSPQKGSPPRSTSPQKPSTTHPEGVQYPIGARGSPLRSTSPPPTDGLADRVLLDDLVTSPQEAPKSQWGRSVGLSPPRRLAPKGSPAWARGEPHAGVVALLALHETIREQELALQRLVRNLTSPSSRSSQGHRQLQVIGVQRAAETPLASGTRGGSSCSPLSPPSSQGISAMAEKVAAEKGATEEGATEEGATEEVVIKD